MKKTVPVSLTLDEIVFIRRLLDAGYANDMEMLPGTHVSMKMAKALDKITRAEVPK